MGRTGFKVDLTNKTYNNLHVDKYIGNSETSGHSLWECSCLCGNDKKVIASSTQLTKDIIRSCGCLGRKKKIRPFETVTTSNNEAAATVEPDDKEFYLFGKKYSLHDLSIKFKISEEDLKERINKNKDKPLADILYP